MPVQLLSHLEIFFPRLVVNGSVILAAGQYAGSDGLTPFDITVDQSAQNVFTQLIATKFIN
jgi:hypothetical protein